MSYNGGYEYQPAQQTAAQSSGSDLSCGWKAAIIVLILCVLALFVTVFVWNPIITSDVNDDGDDIDRLQSKTSALGTQGETITWSAKQKDKVRVKGPLHVYYDATFDKEIDAKGGITLNGGDLVSAYDDIGLIEGNIETLYGSMRATAFNQIVQMQPYFPNGEAAITAGQVVGSYRDGVSLGFATFSQTEFAEEINTDGLSVCSLGPAQVVVLYRATTTGYLTFRLGAINSTTRAVTFYTGAVTIQATTYGVSVTPRFFCHGLSGSTNQFVVAYTHPTATNGVQVRGVTITATTTLAATIGTAANANPSDDSCLMALGNSTGDYYYIVYSSSSDLQYQGFTIVPSTLSVTLGTAVSLGSDTADLASTCDTASAVTLSAGVVVVTYGGDAATDVDAATLIVTQALSVATVNTASTAWYTVTSAFRHNTVRLSDTAFAVVYACEADHQFGQIITGAYDTTTFAVTMATAVHTYNNWPGDIVTPSATYDPLFAALSVPSSGASGNNQYTIVCFRAPTVTVSQEVCQMFHYVSGVFVQAGAVEAFTSTYEIDVFGAFIGWDYFAVVSGDENVVPGDTAEITIGSIDTTELSIDYVYTKPSVPLGLAMQNCTALTCPTGTLIDVMIQGVWEDSTIFANITGPGLAWSHGNGDWAIGSTLRGNQDYVPVHNLYRLKRHTLAVAPAWLAAYARSAAGIVTV